MKPLNQNNMTQTAVEWLVDNIMPMIPFHTLEYRNNFIKFIEQAKAMEHEQSHSYAEFAIRCDRKGMKILNFEDWIKLENFKSE